MLELLNGQPGATIGDCVQTEVQRLLQPVAVRFTQHACTTNTQISTEPTPNANQNNNNLHVKAGKQAGNSRESQSASSPVRSWPHI